MKRPQLAVILAVSIVPAALASSIKDLKTRSNAAVVAHSARWSIQDSALHVVLTVEKSIFGPLQPNSAVYAAYHPKMPSIKTQVPEELPRGLWFLKQDESGWVITPALPNRFASSRNLFFSLVEGALSEPHESLSDEQLTIAAARGLLASGMHPFLWNHMLGREDSPAMRRFLWELVGSLDALVHLVGLTQLLNLGDVDALRSLKEPRDFTGERDNEALADAVPHAIHIFFRNPAPEAIQLLGEFSNDATLKADLREAAAMALSAMHTRESLPYLAKLLDDPNPKLRGRGVIGLSFFANGIGVQSPYGGPTMPHLNNPSPSAYRTEQTARYLGFDAANETEWIAFWKAWWQEHQFDFE
jgi:hypothetical protein